MNNPELKYYINPFVCFGEHDRNGLLESEGDISTGLFMCYFIKLKEFTTKPRRKANYPYFKVFTTETEIKVKRRDIAELNVNNSRNQMADRWIRQHVVSLFSFQTVFFYAKNNKPVGLY